MNKEFLDIIYGEKARLERHIIRLNGVDAFDGSPGSCHQETYNVEVEEVTNQLATIERLITAYVNAHKNSTT